MEEIYSDMNYIEPDTFGIETMKSGRLCLNLTTKMSWEAFPEYATKLVSAINGSIKSKTDSFDIRIWEVSLQDTSIRLVFDDFPVMASFEAIDKSGDSIILHLEELLNVP